MPVISSLNTRFQEKQTLKTPNTYADEVEMCSSTTSSTFQYWEKKRSSAISCKNLDKVNIFADIFLFCKKIVYIRLIHNLKYKLKI